MRIKDFFDNEFKQFSSHDNVRSIPSLIDGFKDSQRKAVYGMRLHGTGEIKVAQAATQFALVTNYDHGEVSMADTIVGLAQNFPGSNNINLFEPLGQFGTILSNESASHRYIYTKPSKHFKECIKPEDECILEYRYDDGKKCEPLYFYPIIPMWLVNGTVGIGTGHSTKILPRDIAKTKSAIKSILSDRKPRSDWLLPCVNRFGGTIVAEENNRYAIHGKLEKVNSTTIRITELPFDYTLDKYKAILITLMDDGIIRDYDNNSSETGFDFTVKVTRDIGRLSEDELVKTFKLTSRQTENITLWDSDGVLTNFDDVLTPLEEFVDFRLHIYEKRRLKQIEILSTELDFLVQKMKFILTWNEIKDVGKKKVSEIRDIMIKAGVKESNLDNLLRLSVVSLSLDLITELEKEFEKKEKEKKVLESTTNKEMYLDEL